MIIYLSINASLHLSRRRCALIYDLTIMYIGIYGYGPNEINDAERVFFFRELKNLDFHTRKMFHTIADGRLY